MDIDLEKSDMKSVSVLPFLSWKACSHVKNINLIPRLISWALLRRVYMLRSSNMYSYQTVQLLSCPQRPIWIPISFRMG